MHFKSLHFHFISFHFISFHLQCVLIARNADGCNSHGRSVCPSVHYALFNEPKMNIVRCSYAGMVSGLKTQCLKFEQ